MGKVRSVYLVSSDRNPRSDFTKAIGYAMGDVRWWFKQQLGGGTFSLHGGVEVVRSRECADWFATHGAKQTGDTTVYFANVLAEAGRILGAKHDDPRFVWVIYCDAPKGGGRGGSGVCILPEADLLGLVGENPSDKRYER